MKIKATIFLLIFFVAGMGFFLVRAATTIWEFKNPAHSDIPPFSWIGNNLQGGKEQGSPVIGMISMKGDKYHVQIEGEGDQRPVIGSAWIGIGNQDDRFEEFDNQDDFPSLGWIHFNPQINSQFSKSNQDETQAKLNELISDNCFGAGDCYPVRWNKKPGSPDTNSYEGYFSGWAYMEIGKPEKNGDGLAYPQALVTASSPPSTNCVAAEGSSLGGSYLCPSDIWVHFRAPSSPDNYTCSEGDHNNYVCVDKDGKIEGYAWSSGGKYFNTISNNPGLGWIKFSKTYISFANSESGTLSQPRFCATTLSSDSQSIGCKDSNNPSGPIEFKFKAYQSGFSLSSSDPDSNFRWYCNPNDAPTIGQQVSCIYQTENSSESFAPTLEVRDENSGYWSGTNSIPACNNRTNVTITNNVKCSVLVRKADTSSGQEFLNSVTVDTNEPVEAKIERQCLTGSVDWNNASNPTTGATRSYIDGDSAGFQPNGGSNGIIRASINGKQCSPAEIRVTESVKFRQ